MERTSIIHNDKSTEKPRPWIRYWARMFDILLFDFIAIKTMHAFIRPGSPEINSVFFGFILLFSWVFVEAFCLSSWGTTPGKKIFKIKFHYPSSAKIPYTEALNRSFQVWLGGLAAGIPIASMVTSIIAYNKLKKDGKTSWDEVIGSTISHEDIGLGRTVAIFIVFIFFGFLFMNT